MTLSVFTSMSSYTDLAPLSPSYFNSKQDVLIANINQLNEDTSALSASYLSTLGIWHVSAFNVAGNGTDETVGIQSAISHIAASGGGELIFSAKSYLASSLTMLYGVNLNLNGATINKSGGAASSHVIDMQGSMSTYSGLLVSHASSGQTFIRTGGAFSASTGSVILISMQSFAYDTTGRFQELVRVASISGTTYYLERALIDTYTTTSVASAILLNACYKSKVANGTLVIPPGINGGGIAADLAYDCDIENLDVVGPADDPGIKIERSGLIRTFKTHVRDGQSLTASGFAYGLMVGESGHDVTIIEHNSSNIRENPITNGAKQITVSGGYHSRNQIDAWNTHGTGVRDVIVRDVTCYASAQDGFNVGQSTSCRSTDRRIRYENCVVRDARANGFVAVGGDDSNTSRMADIEFVNCEVRNFSIGGAGFAGVILTGVDGAIVNNMIISSNTGAGTQRGIRSSSTCVDVIFQNCIIGPITPASTGIDVGSTRSIQIRNNTIRGINGNNINTASLCTDVWVIGNVTDDSANSFPSSGWTMFANSWGTFQNILPVQSSVSTLVGAFVVQGSSSSYTIVVFPAALPSDQFMTTVVASGAVSSLSSGIVLHSHCTQAGQVEMRLSNVSTLAQNQSSRSYFITRITPFPY